MNLLLTSRIKFITLILLEALSKACGDGKAIVDVSKFPRSVDLLCSCCRKCFASFFIVALVFFRNVLYLLACLLFVG